ncbi:MAG: hypothetical protein OXG62_12345 [Nitrospinae bacterium]|nr:hypothetical protein [Nitrospinota bacterium]
MQKMMCPLLLTHGVDDGQMPTSNARKLFDALGSKDKMLKIFTVKEGNPRIASATTSRSASPASRTG